MKPGDVTTGLEGVANATQVAKTATLDTQKKGADSARNEAARSQREAEQRKMNALLDARLGRRNGETIKNNPLPEVEPLLADLASVPPETPIGKPGAETAAATAATAADHEVEKDDADRADARTEEKHEQKKQTRKHAEEKLQRKLRAERRNESEWSDEPGLCDDEGGGSLFSGTVPVFEVILGSGDRLHQMAMVNGSAPVVLVSVPTDLKPVLQRPLRPASKAECQRRCGKDGFCDPSSETGCGGEFCQTFKDQLY